MSRLVDFVLQGPISRSRPELIKRLQADKYFSHESVALQHLVTLAQITDQLPNLVKSAYESMTTATDLPEDIKPMLTTSYEMWQQSATCVLSV